MLYAFLALRERADGGAQSGKQSSEQNAEQGSSQSGEQNDGQDSDQSVSHNNNQSGGHSSEQGSSGQILAARYCRFHIFGIQFHECSMLCGKEVAALADDELWCECWHRNVCEWRGHQKRGAQGRERRGGGHENQRERRASAPLCEALQLAMLRAARVYSQASARPLPQVCRTTLDALGARAALSHGGRDRVCVGWKLPLQQDRALEFAILGRCGAHLSEAAAGADERSAAEAPTGAAEGTVARTAAAAVAEAAEGSATGATDGMRSAETVARPDGGSVALTSAPPAPNHKRERKSR